MKIESKQYVEIIGIFAVVLSLLFVGFELRLSRSVAQSESISQRVELAHYVEEQIIANSDVWARGCLGEELTQSESVEFTSIVSSLINYEFYRWNRATIGITDAPILNGPRVVARSRYNFPGFDAVWEKIGKPFAFGTVVDEQYMLLKNSGAEKISDVSLCGKSNNEQLFE